jgi:hypothetical protein
MRNVLSCVLVAGLGCAGESNMQTIRVTEPNGLGVRSLEISSSDDGTLYELRGLTSTRDEVASVSRRIGEIDDLADIPGKPRIGSEIVLTVQGEQTRMVSRETQLLRIPPSSDATTQQFLELGAVESALAPAHILVSNMPASSESPYSVESCPTNILLNTPTADQCCYTTAIPNDNFSWTYFVAASGKNQGKIVYREKSNICDPCTSQNCGTCNGGDCYWGPLGFAMAVASSGTGTPVVLTGSGSGSGSSTEYCYAAFFGSDPPEITFRNVTGTQPTDLGCPGSSAGDGDWDY